MSMTFLLETMTLVCSGACKGKYIIGREMYKDGAVFQGSCVECQGSFDRGIVICSRDLNWRKHICISFSTDYCHQIVLM